MEQWRKVSYSTVDLEQMQQSALHRVRNMQQQANHHLQQFNDDAAQNRTVVAKAKLEPEEETMPLLVKAHPQPVAESMPFITKAEPTSVSIPVVAMSSPILSSMQKEDNSQIGLPAKAPNVEHHPAHFSNQNITNTTFPINPVQEDFSFRETVTTHTVPPQVFSLPTEGDTPSLSKSSKSLRDTAVGLGGSITETITDTIEGITSPLTKIMDAVGIDNDKLLIIGLLIVLLNEKSDKTLLMALGYLLFT